MGATVSGAVASLVVLAVASDGYHATATELHDGTVWTIAHDRDAVLRINARIDEFDTRIRSDMEGADLLQDGRSVYLETPSGLTPLNAFGTSIDTGIEPVEFPSGMQFGVGGGAAAALHPDGRLWVTPAGSLTGIDVDETEPTATLGAGSYLAVTPDGVVTVLDPTDDTVTVVETYYASVDADAQQTVMRDAVPFGHAVPATGETADDLQYTAVGDTAVALLGDRLLIAGREPVDLAGVDTSAARLQQPGVRSAEVLLADPAALWLVPLDEPVPRERVSGGSGPPAAPVVVGGCAYAGWEALGRVWRQCAGGTDEVLDATVDAVPGTDWVFRVNRTEVVLEARGADPIHITDLGLVAIDNWLDFESELEQPDDVDSDEVLDQSETAECRDGQEPPEAADDEFGATPGASIVLRVLDNDRDPNCDPIAIQSIESWDDAWGRVDLIEYDQAIQYTPPPTPITFTFGYTIDDGRGGEASARVTIDSTGTSNEPPRPKEGRASATIVELFRSVTYNVLVDWEDPDGDPMLLQAALIDAGDGSLTFSKDGTITYTATDTAAGPKDITVIVTDGFGNAAEGLLSISVQGEGVPLPPTARDDFVEMPAGREVAVRPLANDTDPNDDQLVLGRYEVPDDLRLTQGENGVLRVSGDNPGTYLITYEATDGVLSDSATIRVEVTPTDQPQRPPIAVRDSVVVQEGTSLSVDVLGNDYDPDGDVLILTDAALEQTGLAGVRVDPLERRFVRVQVDQDPDQPIAVEYWVSDGINPPQRGQLVVIVGPPGNEIPIPGDDVARVRVGDTVDIPILANDTDPDGDRLVILDAQLDPADQPGTLWLDGTTLRYRAGAEPGRVTASYTVDDDPENPGLHAASAVVEITVTPDDPDGNLPPTPPTLEARVFAGSEVLIPIPPGGHDPDGDSIRIVEIGPSPGPNSTFPKFGTPTVLRSAIRYAAFPSVAGQDVFTYEVEDTYGARAVGVVRVVVATGANHPPALVPDSITVRPSRILQVPVLSNDSDADGDPLTLVDVEGPAELVPVVNGTRVQVEIPAVAGTWQLLYTATDGRGPDRQQTLTIVADPDAPLLAAIARDDPDVDVEPELSEAPDGTWTTTLSVLDNDDDPDGVRAELLVAIPEGQGVEAVLGGPSAPGSITVTLTDRPQALVYSVTDIDGNVSFAVVRVPRAPQPVSAEEEDPNRPPVLRDDVEPLTVVAGEATAIPVDHYVADPDGDPVQLAGETPSSPHGEVTLTSGQFGSFTFTAAEIAGTSATIFVPVTDRPGEPESTVVLPFRVVVEKPNEPPVTEPYPLDVEQLADAAPVDLVASGAVTDPENDPLTFDLVEGGAQGLSVDLSPDGVVTAQAEGAAEGVTATFRYTVSDGQDGHEPVEGTFTVRVVASTKPLVQLASIARQDIPQGQSETVEPLVGIANPFPQIPLRIIGAELVSGSGTVTFTDSTVTFTPPDDYFGRAEVRYTVEDGTKSVARHARGTVTYTVIGRPLPPGQPRVVEVASHTASIEWTPADPQGSPITDYTVTWSGGTLSTGGATVATITSLTNYPATPYTFTVTATNAVGVSDPSAPSQDVRPDEVPAQPAAPRVVDFGDEVLFIEFDEATVDGSPVFQYHLSLSGGETKILAPSAVGTRIAWDGLTNGKDYTFSIVAENQAGRSDRSTLSNALSPAREPDAPSQPVATDVGNELVAEVLVEWTEPASNGRDIDSYEITVDATGAVHQAVGTSIRIQLAPGLASSFTVRAHNVVGYSLPSAASAPFEAVVAPSAPATPQTVERDRRIQVTAPTPGSSGGAPITSYQYSLSGGPWTNLGGQSGEIAGLTNGQSYTVAVRACNKKFCSPSSPTVTNLIPYGPPSLGTGTFTRSGPVAGSRNFTLGWNTTSAANGRPIVNRRITFTQGGITAGPWVDSNVASTGSASFTGNWSTNYVIVLTVTDSEGQTASRQMSFSIGPQPDTRVLSLAKGPSAVGEPGCTVSICKWYSISLSGFAPNSSVTVNCAGSTQGTWRTFTITTTGSGSYSTTSRCYFGYYENAYIWTSSQGGYKESNRVYWG